MQLPVFPWEVGILATFQKCSVIRLIILVYFLPVSLDAAVNLMQQLKLSSRSRKMTGLSFIGSDAEKMILFTNPVKTFAKNWIRLGYLIHIMKMKEGM